MSEEPIEITANHHYRSKLWKIKNLFVKGTVVIKSIHSQGNFFRYLFSKKGFRLISKFFQKSFAILTGNNQSDADKIASYQRWLQTNSPSEADFLFYQEQCLRFSYQPKISILVPVYNTRKDFLTATINSVLDQIYQNWELCLADDCSPSEEPRAIIREYMAQDNRIKAVFRTRNGHISESTNSALEIATGEFCALFDHDDLLTKDALYQMVVLLNKNKNADIIYSDEDKTVNGTDFIEPHFKPQWSPDNLLSRNYIGHLTVIRTTLLREIGGFRKEFDGSQDYDLYLRATEKTRNIYHLPKVLYHWRMHENSVAANTYSKPYAYIAGKKAIEQAIARRNEAGQVEMLEEEMLGFYSIRYTVAKKEKVSIIIPAKNKSELLEQCINSIVKLSTYEHFEIIVVDNGSDEPAFHELTKKYKQQLKEIFNCYTYNIPFNFSALINFGASKATGEYLLLLNNDTKLITKDWLERMTEQCSRVSIGVVGVKLLFPNNTIQHAGVVIESAGTVRHIHAGIKKDTDTVLIHSVNNYPALTGACFMTKKNVFQQLGGFDENFAVEYNDIDFCLKAIKAGYFNVYIPSVEMYHYESISRGHSDTNSKKYERFRYEHERFNTVWADYIRQYALENAGFLEFN